MPHPMVICGPRWPGSATPKRGWRTTRPPRILGTCCWPPTRSIGSSLQPLRLLVEHGAQDGFDGVELGLTADQRRRQLDDGIASVIGATVQPGLEQGRRPPAQQRPAFLVGEGLLGRLVLDQFDAVEIPLAADVADDG